MDLLEPSKKMSKSDPAGAVRLVDPPEVIRKKFARAVTDSLASIRFNPEQEGLYNLLTMIQGFTGESQEAIELRFAGRGYRAIKECCAELVIDALHPLQQRYQEFLDEPAVVDRILRRGAERARPIARAKVATVADRMGLRRPEGADAVALP
jgi:tryptophanyl-tRNA synthetase